MKNVNKEKNKKTLELFQPDQQLFPLDVCTPPLSLSRSPGILGGWGA